MINYSLVMRKNPLKKDATEKAHATAQCKSVMKIEDVAAHIERHGSILDRSVIESVVIKLSTCVRELLLDGYQVELGDLGKFELALDCEGADSAAEFTPETHIKDVHVRWRPSKKFKNLRKDASFHQNTTRKVQKERLKAHYGSKN